MSAIDRIQLGQSDVIWFHNYDTAPESRSSLAWLRRYRRPMLCTEYMARRKGSTFEASLPLGEQLHRRGQ